MSVQEAVQQLENFPLAERIQAIELLLQSLKEEIAQTTSTQTENKPFRVRTFNLGTDIQVDRDEIYTERML
mgnify:CR=1 FL=1